MHPQSPVSASPFSYIFPTFPISPNLKRKHIPFFFLLPSSIIPKISREYRKNYFLPPEFAEPSKNLKFDQDLYALIENKMSCNGCRILRKGCNENCILRQSLLGIQSPQAQANAAVFVAKFFGRAGLMSFLSSVPESQRPAMFESLLYEACGRTVNPVNGAVGLLWNGNWHVCQAAVETVYQGGVLAPIVQFPSRAQPLEETDDYDQASNLHLSMPGNLQQQPDQHQVSNVISRFPARMTARGREKRRAATPEESGTTTSESCLEYNCQNPTGGDGQEGPVLRLFL